MIPPSAFRLRDEFDPVVSFAPPFRLFGTDRLSVFLGLTQGMYAMRLLLETCRGHNMICMLWTHAVS